MTEDALLDLWRTRDHHRRRGRRAVRARRARRRARRSRSCRPRRSSKRARCTFVPKLGVALFVLALGGHWMLDKLGHFAVASFRSSSEPYRSTTSPRRRPSHRRHEPGHHRADARRVHRRADALRARSRCTAPVIGDGGVPVRAKLVLRVSVALAIAANHPGVRVRRTCRDRSARARVGRRHRLTASFVLARARDRRPDDGPRARPWLRVGVRPARRRIAGVIRTIATTLAGLAFLAADGSKRSSAASRRRRSAIAVGTRLPQLLAVGAAAFGHGLALAAPVVLAALVGKSGLAVMNRAAPAINVFSVSLSDRARARRRRYCSRRAARSSSASSEAAASSGPSSSRRSSRQ